MIHPNGKSETYEANPFPIQKNKTCQTKANLAITHNSHTADFQLTRCKTKQFTVYIMSTSQLTTNFVTLTEDRSPHLHCLKHLTLQILHLGQTKAKKKQYKTNLILSDGSHSIRAVCHNRCKQQHESLKLYMVVRLIGWKVIYPEPYLYFRNYECKTHTKHYISTNNMAPTTTNGISHFTQLREEQIFLEQVLRLDENQKDNREMLKRIRNGSCTPDDEETLRTLVLNSSNYSAKEKKQIKSEA